MAPSLLSSLRTRSAGSRLREKAEPNAEVHTIAAIRLQQERAPAPLNIARTFSHMLQDAGICFNQACQLGWCHKRCRACYVQESLCWYLSHNSLVTTQHFLLVICDNNVDGLFLQTKIFILTKVLQFLYLISPHSLFPILSIMIASQKPQEAEEGIFELWVHVAAVCFVTLFYLSLFQIEAQWLQPGNGLDDLWPCSRSFLVCTRMLHVHERSAQVAFWLHVFRYYSGSWLWMGSMLSAESIPTMLRFKIRYFQQS